MAQSKYTKAIAKFSKIRNNRKIKATFTTTEGAQHSADTMAHHLQQIYAGNFLPAHAPRDIPYQLDPQPFDITNCSFDTDTIYTAIKEPPQHKAPGVDHFTIEMLSPITDILTLILLYIFRLCWQWSYTPLPWRVAQVIPIHKKGPVSDPGNFHPISLTSTFRKILEKCLYPTLEQERPSLDIAQGGFRPARSTLDQALCLLEICSILRRKHRTPPTTGVLQGSILSPFLYSMYINQLPSLLRHQPPDEAPSQDICRLTESLNCLLYADDVVLIANPTELEVLLQKCEEHSQRLGYRLNPLKCAILAPPTDSRRYALYDTLLPRQTSFSYLGIPLALVDF
ncbi:hypothetical protein G6F38_011798 [Rhizopus arrhizus]|nr:hypothetical protein G6F38_011798 [Rhizopus arrhizus]